jgi:WD40 repeat protein
MKGHIGYVLTIAFSPDGSRIVSGSQDNTIRIWDVQTAKQTHRLDGHTNDVRSVAFSSDGHWIASGSDDKTVRVWNSETGEPVGLPLIGHTSYVHGCFFLP